MNFYGFIVRLVAVKISLFIIIIINLLQTGTGPIRDTSVAMTGSHTRGKSLCGSFKAPFSNLTEVECPVNRTGTDRGNNTGYRSHFV